MAAAFPNLLYLSTMGKNNKAHKQEYDREYYKKNRAKIIKRSKDYAEKNKEKVRESQKEYRERNRERITRNKHEYYEANKEQLLAKSHERYVNNIDHIREQTKEYRKANADAIKKRKKAYADSHKEQLSEYTRNYREQHADDIHRKNVERYEANREKYKDSSREWYRKRKAAGYDMVRDESGKLIWKHRVTGEIIVPKRRAAPKYPKKPRDTQPSKYTYEVCRDLAALYSSRWDFGKHEPTAYNISIKNGWIDDFFPPPTRHSEEEVAEAARKYGDRLEFKKEEPALYDWASRKKLLDKYFRRILRPPMDGKTAAEAAARCSTRSELAKKDEAAYNWGLNHGKLDEWFPPDTGPTFEDCLRAAEGCKSRKDFKVKHYTEYRVARINKWLGMLGLPDTAAVRSAASRKFSDEDVELAARKYTVLADFRKNDPNMAAIAYKRGMMKKFTWLVQRPGLEQIGNIDTVYAYEFVGTKAVYVGRTIEPHRRDVSHRHKKDSVFKYANKHGVEIPEMRILISGVPPVDGSRLEAVAVETYRELGWTLINKAKAGSLGGLACNKLTIKYCLEVARKYEYLQDMIKNEGSVYNKLRDTGKLSLCTWLKRQRELPHRWKSASDDEIRAKAAEFNSAAEFMAGCPTAHHEASMRRMMQELFPGTRRMGPREVVQMDLDGKPLRTFPSMKDAAEALGVRPQCVSRVCRNDPGHHKLKGFRFKYADAP